MLTVTRKSEDDMLADLGTELGFLTSVASFDGEPLALDGYQIAFLQNQSKYRWVVKARQVGFSFLFACEAIARCHLREGHTSIFVSYNLDDAKEKVNYARQLHEELPLAYRKRVVTDSKTELGFESSGASKRISRIISVPSKAPRGKKGDLYLDELAHYANDREVYKGSTALILRARGQLTGCSSPLGRRGVFWEIAEEELRPYPTYSRQSVPWWLCRFFSRGESGAAREAAYLSTEERVRRFGKPDIQNQFDSLALEDFQQEFECVPEGDLVLTDAGPRPIESIEPGQRVLTHQGRLRPVEAIYKKHYTGNLIKIRTYHAGIPLRLTPEHPVLAIETQPCRYGRQVRCYPWCGQRCAYKPAALAEPAFVPAAQLTPQHIVLTPVQNSDEESPPTKVFVRDYFEYPPSYRSKNRIPDEIPLSNEFLRLAGYYLAEGSIESNGRRVVFCFHRKEHRYVAEVRRAIRKLFGLRTDDRISSRSPQSRKVGVNSVVLASLFSRLFGRLQPDRHIPSSWMSLPLERLRYLTHAFLNGDGCRRPEKVIVSISSRTLAYQLRQIFIRAGLVPSLHEKPGGPRRIRRRDCVSGKLYVLQVYRRQSDDRRGRRGWNDGRYVYLPVTEVTQEPYAGTVHNLHVREDNSYIVGYHAVHNCNFVDESYSFYPYELILPCTSDEHETYSDVQAFPTPIRGRLTAGFDVGRKRDLSELVIVEEIEGTFHLRLWRSYDRVPFAEQEADLDRMLDTLPIARLSIDQGGIGMHLTENLCRRHGPIIRPENFTNQSKEIWCNDFKILLQRGSVVMPRDRELIAQIHSIKKSLTPSGKASFDAERAAGRSKGHADRFWALVLACQKERFAQADANELDVAVRVIG